MHPWQQLTGNAELDASPRTDPYDSSRLQISDVRSKIEADESNEDMKSKEGNGYGRDFSDHDSRAPIYQIRKPFIPPTPSTEMDICKPEYLPITTLASVDVDYEGEEYECESEDDNASMCSLVTRSVTDSHKTPAPSGTSRRRAALAGENRTKMTLATEERVPLNSNYFRKQKMKAVAAGKPWPNPKKLVASRRKSLPNAQPSDSDAEDETLIATSTDKKKIALQGTQRPFWCHVCGTRFVHIRCLSPHYNTEDHLSKRDLVGLTDADDQEYLNRQAKLRPFHCILCNIRFLDFPLLQEHFNDNHTNRRAQHRGLRKNWESESIVVTPVRLRTESQSLSNPQHEGSTKEGKHSQPQSLPVTSNSSRPPKRTSRSKNAKPTSLPVDSDSDSWSTKQSTSKRRSCKYKSAKNETDGPYKCEPCKVAFNRIADLKRHFGTDRHCFKKTGVRARRGITCTICATAFTRLDAAYRHVQRSHTYEFKVYGGDIIQQADADGEPSS